tara:strand:+ start:2677 stop:3228 length:552 start_codon:yes stop_codon:yes gene_type:complete
MLCLVPHETAKTSLDARKTAVTIMATGEIKDIVDSDFYDSFCVGGAWTGTLTTRLLDQEKLQTFDNEVKEKYQWPVERSVGGLNNDSRTEKQKMALDVFLKYFPNFEGEPPFFRSDNANMGYDDDALFISNERQYYKLLGDYEGKWFSSSEYQMIDMFNLSKSIVTPENVINKHWVVVLTCHR